MKIMNERFLRYLDTSNPPIQAEKPKNHENL